MIRRVEACSSGRSAVARGFAALRRGIRHLAVAAAQTTHEGCVEALESALLTSAAGASRLERRHMGGATALTTLAVAVDEGVGNPGAVSRD